HAEPRGGARREHHPAGEPALVGMAVSAVPPPRQPIRGARTLANVLPSDILRLGRDRRYRISAAVSVHVNPIEGAVVYVEVYSSCVRVGTREPASGGVGRSGTTRRRPGGTARS